jgi:aminoglycoside phosphotransferase (APT) family kinase protein
MESFQLLTYHLLSTPTSFDSIRYFKFGIPLVLKRSARTISTEADALRFLNNCGLDLPVPCILDSIVVGGQTFTLMTRIPGELLIDKFEALSDSQLNIIIQDVFAVLRSLWTLRQPTQDSGKVMLSASDHGLPSPAQLFDDLEGPYDSILDCYVHMSSHLVGSKEELQQLYPAASQALVTDAIVYVHADLRSHNILVKDGRLSGIIDWENSGWLPRHWQLHVLRRSCPSTRGNLRKLINDMRGPDESEAAYKESKSLLRYHL